MLHFMLGKERRRCEYFVVVKCPNSLVFLCANNQMSILINVLQPKECIWVELYNIIMFMISRSQVCQMTCSVMSVNRL